MIFYSLRKCVELDSMKNIIILHFSCPKICTAWTTFTFHTVTSSTAINRLFITFRTYNFALMCGIVRYSVK